MQRDSLLLEACLIHTAASARWDGEPSKFGTVSTVFTRSFQLSTQTVKTVTGKAELLITGLKPGVNETTIFRTSGGKPNQV